MHNRKYFGEQYGELKREFFNKNPRSTIGGF